MGRQNQNSLGIGFWLPSSPLVSWPPLNLSLDLLTQRRFALCWLDLLEIRWRLVCCWYIGLLPIQSMTVGILIFGYLWIYGMLAIWWISDYPLVVIDLSIYGLPSGKQPHNDGKSPLFCLFGISAISWSFSIAKCWHNQQAMVVNIICQSSGSWTQLQPSVARRYPCRTNHHHWAPRI